MLQMSSSHSTDDYDAAQQRPGISWIPLQLQDRQHQHWVIQTTRYGECKRTKNIIYKFDRLHNKSHNVYDFMIDDVFFVKFLFKATHICLIAVFNMRNESYIFPFPYEIINVCNTFRRPKQTPDLSIASLSSILCCLLFINMNFINYYDHLCLQYSNFSYTHWRQWHRGMEENKGINEINHTWFICLKIIWFCFIIVCVWDLRST